MSGSSCVPLEYRGCATPEGWVTPKKTCILGVWGLAECSPGREPHSVAASCVLLLFLLSCLQCFDTVGWAAGRAPGLSKIWGMVEVGTG